MRKENLFRKYAGTGSMIPEIPPQRSAELGLTPSTIIERAAQHLDWTIAFGVRRNTPRGFDGTHEPATPTKSSSHCPGIAAELQPSRGRRLLLASGLSIAFVVVGAGAGIGNFLLTRSTGEKATPKSALATEAPAPVSDDMTLIRGMAVTGSTVSTAQSDRLAEQALTPAASEWEAKRTLGPPPSPPGWPKSEIAAPPASSLEASSTVASPALRKQPIVTTFSGLEIAELVARGEWLFATGDVASARLLYERAAHAGEARAAVRLGETFDPNYLQNSHLRGLHGDPDMAVFWYRHARDLGATGVASRLKDLEAKEGRH